MSSDYKYMVGIQCLTYQHAKYIQDALAGFVMQQTTFPFSCMVMDDASTDGEVEVLRKYIVEQCVQDETVETEHDLYFKVCTRAKENGNCHFEFYFLKQNLYGTGKKPPIIQEWESQCKYIALCEGDDYWTDLLKLQKQVDFLEEHEDFGSCFCRYTTYFEDTKEYRKSDHFDGIISSNASGFELNKDNYLQIGKLPLVLTDMHRTNLVNKDSFYYKINPRSRYDQTLYYAYAQEAKIWIMNENMGVYRRHAGGVATSVRGTIAESRKQYITWKDVYEVKKDAETYDLYHWALSTYIYNYAKRGVSFQMHELNGLIKEYFRLVNSHRSRIWIIYRSARGLFLRLTKKLKEKH